MRKNTIRILEIHCLLNQFLKVAYAQKKALNLKVGDFQDNTDEFYSVKILEDTGKYETILVPKKLIKTDLDRIIKINDSEAYVFNAGKNPNKPLSLQTAYKIFKQIRLSI